MIALTSLGYFCAQYIASSPETEWGTNIKGASILDNAKAFRVSSSTVSKSREVFVASLQPYPDLSTTAILYSPDNIDHNGLKSRVGQLVPLIN
jgi:hypothetical protein